MFRKICAVALILTACGDPSMGTDGGVDAGVDAGPMALTASGTATGTYGFTVKTAFAVSPDGGAPVAVFLYDAVLPCPARFDEAPSVEGQGLLMQQNSGTFALGTYAAPNQLFVLRGHFRPDASFPEPVGADSLTGTVTVTSVNRGVVGTYQFTNSDGGTLSGQFSAPTCGAP
ncbi:MAG: hypothetical protein K1X64_02200 [Myxococcaceae bacterium]|nr:hypothetical protein [Myxococcaceae bacterium]